VDAIAPLGRGGDVKFAHVSDDELLARTRRLVGATNQILAELLAHLAEVEARGIHRERFFGRRAFGGQRQFALPVSQFVDR
jgi:hypothetical protein